MKMMLKRPMPVFIVLAITVLAVGATVMLSRASYGTTQNVFEEMYDETELSYLSDNILKNIDKFDIRPAWPNDDVNTSKVPYGSYKQEARPEGYSDITIGFNFKSNRQTVLISFEKEIGPNVRVSIWNKYNKKNDTMVKSVNITLEQGVSDKYIEKEADIKAYLKEHHISSKDLDCS